MGEQESSASTQPAGCLTSAIELIGDNHRRGQLRLDHRDYRAGTLQAYVAEVQLVMVLQARKLIADLSGIAGKDSEHLRFVEHVQRTEEVALSRNLYHLYSHKPLES